MWLLFIDSIVGAIVGSTVLLAIAVAIECIAPLETYTMRQRVPGLLMNIVGAVGGVILVWPFSVLLRSSELAPWVTVPLWSWIEPLGWVAYGVQFAVLLIIADFLAYWRHRAEHSKWLWPVHAVHHSATELHAANSLGHPVQALFSYVFIVLPMSFVQVSGPGVPIFVGLLVALLAVYIHSPVDFHFGRFRKVLVDNRFHRIHHSLEPRHFDKNFGIFLSYWDYMFGTAYDPGTEWPTVGLADVPAPLTVRDFLKLPVPIYREMMILAARGSRKGSAESQKTMAEPAGHDRREDRDAMPDAFCVAGDVQSG